MQTLNDTLNAALKFGGPEFYKSRVPAYIYSNLKNGFGQRLYQQEAFGRFIFYCNEYHDKPKDTPTQLLFHMATGSGKTLIMAGLIIHLYEKGYRNFLFFVNSTNIIDKTKDNFFNTASSKYLFADNISIGEKQILIKEVSNFQAANQDNVNIVFSTIQGLHSRLNMPKENSLTYDDFEDKKIVLISDEAHHINAETKKGSELGTEEKEEIISWESTVNRIFNANRDNMLLEFTATADLALPEIEKKYSNKLIFDYPLKQFRNDGYSKEVKVLQADLSPFDRALQGILLSQYRRKIFEKHKKLIKPVILFKSKSIKESQAFFEEFINKVRNLKVSDVERIKNSKPDEAIEKVFKYLETSNISLENLIIELCEDFSEEKLISVNSKDESEQKQLAVNSLEDESNEYRAVFAVDKLNEGWDVLNLFDIVRLYDTRDAKDGKPGKTTMAEAQLIGRGARYCPFQITEDQPYFERKFDEDITNELRVCEELYYHSAYNPRYIDELNTALEEIGIKAKKSIERPIKLKKEFKDTLFYKTGHIFINEQIIDDRKDVYGITSTLIEQTHKVKLPTGFSKSNVMMEKINVETPNTKEEPYNLIDFGEHIIRKALNKLEFYEFSNLKRHYPNLNSITEFITSKNYLSGKIKLDVSGLVDHVKNLTSDEKLYCAVKVLKDAAEIMSKETNYFKGTKEFKPYMFKDRIKDKVLNFAIENSNDKESGKSMNNPTETNYHLDLSKRDWYVFNDCFGTSEEKLFIKYIDKVYDKLKLTYEEIYLVRNERHFKIYNFNDGRPTEPDFILFLVNHKPEEHLHYQIFIEPKGSHLLKEDEWKEKFLISLRKEHQLEQLWKDKKYVVWGMPFYNEALRKTEFDTSFNDLFE